MVKGQIIGLARITVHYMVLKNEKFWDNLGTLLSC